VIVTLYLAFGSSLFDRRTPLVWGGSQPGWLVVLNHATVVLANLVPAVYIGRSWSLALEEQIYGLYSLLQRLQRFDPQRFVLPALALCIGFIAFVQLVTGGWDPGGKGAYSLWQLFALFQVPTNAFAWVLGAWIAEAHAGRRTLPSWFARPSTAAALLAAGVVLRYHPMPVGRLAIGGLLIVPVFSAGYASLTAWLLRRGDARAEAPRALAPLVTVGLWSYSVYLLHQPFLDLVDRRLHLSRAIEIPLGWALAIGASGVFFHLVERHFIRRAANRPRTVVADPATR
jgi:peptidoglycan/LPS O-acetylase OafA/YrhL